MTVTLFSLMGCSQCEATEKRLSHKGIRYRKVLIDEDRVRQEELRAAGFLTVPVVRAEKAGQKVMEFAGFSDERINQLRSLIQAS
jgi:glutaredoxin